WILALRAGIRDRLICSFEENYNNDALPRRQRRLMAEAALRMDPTHEDACRMVMRLAAEDGEIGPALRAYANLYGVLADEMDMEPSSATQGLAAEIKQGKFDLPSRGERSSMSMMIGWPPIRKLTHAGAPIVAVLPFRPLGPDLVPRFFSEGIVDDIVRMLTTLREP